MTQQQRTVLARFDSINAGAIRFNDEWLFKQDIRNDAELAARVAASLTDGNGIEFKSAFRCAS